MKLAMNQISIISKLPALLRNTVLQTKAKIPFQGLGPAAFSCAAPKHTNEGGQSCLYPIPQVQNEAPKFSGTAVVDKEFKQISLSDFAGKYLVLFFYPLDFTFVCPTEIVAFSDRISEFHAVNCNIVGCSCDSHFTHLAWINTPRNQGGIGDIKYPLLADFNKAVAKSYGVLVEDQSVTLRGLFIIDSKGILRQITINDLPVGRSVDEVLRLVKAFQFADEHGEVCPANWKPNSPTIKPNTIESKEYFEKHH